MSRLELDEVNTIDQAAAFLKIEPAQLRRLVGSQKIGSLKSGRTLTFPREAIEAYVEKYQSKPLPANPHGLTNVSAARIRGRAA